MAETVSTDRLVRAYIKIRNEKAEHTRTYEARQAEFKSALKMIEVELLRRADAQNVDGFKVEGVGTTYKDEDMNVSLRDDLAFYAFVRETGDLEFFERRVTVKHVKEYMEEHDGELPPGLHVFRETRMKVRTARKKKGERNVTTASRDD